VGLIVLDTGVIIAVLDSGDPFHNAARRRLSASRDAGDQFLFPVIAYAEALVGAISSGKGAETILKSFLDELPAQIVTFDRETSRAAAALRARAISRRRGKQWRLPDAMIVATAIVHGADRVITTDAGWPRLARRRPSIEILRPE
jgi:predicted nucleic acid-binding protein